MPGSIRSRINRSKPCGSASTSPQRRRPVGHDLGVVSLGFQVVFDPEGDVLFVFDNQDPFHGVRAD